VPKRKWRHHALIGRRHSIVYHAMLCSTSIRCWTVDRWALTVFMLSMTSLCTDAYMGTGCRAMHLCGETVSVNKRSVIRIMALLWRFDDRIIHSYWPREHSDFPSISRRGNYQRICNKECFESAESKLRQRLCSISCTYLLTNVLCSKQPYVNTSMSLRSVKRSGRHNITGLLSLVTGITHIYENN